jgi:hypothetical protein
MADRTDGLFWIVSDHLRSCSFLHLQRTEFLVPMNPRWPDMLLAARFVIAEDTWWELFGFIVSFVHVRVRRFLLFCLKRATTTPARLTVERMDAPRLR